MSFHRGEKVDTPGGAGIVVGQRWVDDQHLDFDVLVKVDAETIRFPSHEVTYPAGTRFVCPTCKYEMSQPLKVREPTCSRGGHRTAEMRPK